MPQTKEGAKKARATMYQKYGKDYFKNIGTAGGKKGTTGGFYYAKENYTEDDPRHPANAGRIGGHISKRVSSVQA